MAGNDVSQLQVLAHGTVSSANPPVTTLQGVTLVFTNVGSYVFTLDPGLPGDVACEASKLRCVVTILGSPSGFADVVKTSTTVTTITTFAVDGTTPANKAFDFILFKSPY
jgi:hypothetical protein